MPSTQATAESLSQSLLAFRESLPAEQQSALDDLLASFSAQVEAVSERGAPPGLELIDTPDAAGLVAEARSRLREERARANAPGDTDLGITPTTTTITITTTVASHPIITCKAEEPGVVAPR